MLGLAWSLLLLLLLMAPQSQQLWLSQQQQRPLVRAVEAAKEAAKEDNNASYWQRRERLYQRDRSTSLGADIILSDEEEKLNAIYKDILKKEMDSAFETLAFPPSKNFLNSKHEMEESGVFSIVKDMPKGAILHWHDTAMTSVEFVVANITYMDNLFICNGSDSLGFWFSEEVPTLPCEVEWQSVEEQRAAYSSVEAYDAYLYGRISLATDDPDAAYPDINAVWVKFGQYFGAMAGLLFYRPAFEAYLTQAMQESMQDGVSYFEFRGTLDPLYELDGSKLTRVQTVASYKRTVDAFVEQNGDNFLGVRFIYAPQRLVPVETVWEYVDTVRTLREAFPDFVAGFDLVGQEDQGNPLKDFIEPLLTLSEGEDNVPVFYHQGETNWYGLDTDENMYDALLLNASRVGHGYALSKHPTLLQELREKDIPIEVSPISNQVLRLVEDLRNHPAAGYAAAGQPMVVSSDDPAVWAALPLSHDFYEAVMAFGGARSDLRFAKQLAINSIKYTSLDGDRKDKLHLMWSRQWDDFVSSSLVKLDTGYLESNEVYHSGEVNQD